MKILLVSSSGGHWVQMCRVKDAFQGEDIYFASTENSYGQHNPESPFFYLPDASRWNKLKLIWQAFSVLVLLIRLKPDIILTTGASVGVFALILGKKLGARTIWLDSIANSEELSLSGQKVRKYADLYLTQWQHLATNNGPEYAGSVI
ncbi:UDP-N-acetylglucosamine--LPS N-acetylglucosamine transferase [Bacterioplanoides sp.]|uniref:UDP-N-acetylglucosamine--LPS N-acetylglucosamine transferase n=1 Tax=Bacterioplanoides sp. TaxID=2066072 RepID=UPI003B00481E